MPSVTDIHSVRRALDEARRVYWEDPEGSLAAAVRCQESARTLQAGDLRTRALALQGAITLHRGDLRGAVALAAEAERQAELGGSDEAQVEVAALKAHLSFFSGSYTEALLEGTSGRSTSPTAPATWRCGCSPVAPRAWCSATSA